MATLALLLLLFHQDPTVADLIRRLDSEKHQAREEAQAALLARGASALKEVEAAFAAAAPGELRIRLGLLIRPLRLAELTEKVPGQFSESLRAASPDLLERLKKPDPGNLIDAIASLCGKASHWETEEKPASHGTYKVAREITREPLKGTTRADVAELILLALRALPDRPLDERWSAVERSARGAIKIEEGADRRILSQELLALRSGERGAAFMQEILSRCKDTADLPFALALLEDPDPRVAQYASIAIQGIDPGPFSDDLVRKLPGLKPGCRAAFLRCLQNTKDRKFLKLYLELVDDPEMHVKWAAFTAAAATDPESLTETVLKKLKSGTDDDVAFGLQMAFRLKPMGKPPKVEFVREAGRIFMTAATEKVQGAAFNLMVWAQGEGCTEEQVIRALTHPTAGFRRHATSLAQKFQGPGVIAALKKLVDDPDDEVAAFATVTLVGVKQTCSLDRVRSLITKPCSTNAKSQAMMSLVYSLGKEARKDIAPLLDDKEEILQIMVLQQFASLGADGFEDKIRPKLGAKDTSVCLAAVQALAPTGDAACWPAIKRGMERDCWQFAPSASLLAWPEKTKSLMAVTLNVPDGGTPAAGLLEDLRKSLAPLGIELKITLSAEALATRVTRPALQEKTVFWFSWLPSLIEDTFWYFDGSTLTILRRLEAKALWTHWVKSR